MEKIHIVSKKRALPKWISDEEILDLVERMYHRLDETFPVVTASNGHHYRKERNLKPFIARWMSHAYKKGSKHRTEKLFKEL